MVCNNIFWVFLILCVHHGSAGAFPPGHRLMEQPPSGAWLVLVAEPTENQVLALKVSTWE